MSVEWIEITKFGPNPIGAIGFVDGKAAIVVAYYDDLDGNKDGKVGWGEWVAGKISPINIEGSAVVEVAMQARVEMDVLMKDPSFPQVAGNMFLNFARGLVIDGIYAAYFARGVSMASRGVAKIVTSGTIKEMVVRKGMETAVKKAFNEAVAR